MLDDGEERSGEVRARLEKCFLIYTPSRSKSVQHVRYTIVGRSRRQPTRDRRSHRGDLSRDAYEITRDSDAIPINFK